MVLVGLLLVAAVGRHEGVLRMVEEVEEALMEGDARTEYGGQHQRCGQLKAGGLGKRCLNLALAVLEGL